MRQALNLRLVQDVLAAHNNRLQPHQRLTDSEIKTSAGILLADLSRRGWDVERFSRACEIHREHSDCVPTTRALVRADAEGRVLVAEPIPLPPGDEEIAAQLDTNRRWLDKWFKQVGRDKRIPA